jgi:phosphoglycerol transferase MdoB-like AlkP superfamily enzyme
MAAFRLIIIALLACIGVFTLSRLGMVVWQFDRVAAAGLDKLPFIFGQGLRFDLVTLGLLFGLPVILTPLFIVNESLAKRWLPVLRIFCLLAFGLVVYMEVATPSFINEFDVKPDRRFLEYLIYPKEVFSMLWSAYKLQIMLAIALVGSSVYILNRILRRSTTPVLTVRPWTPILLIPLIALTLLVAIRSTTDHRPVNPSTVVYTTDPLANQLPLNSTYTAMYALYELRHEEEGFAYAKVPWEEAISAVREDMRVADELFIDGANSTRHVQIATHQTDAPLNLVIVLEESLGADYVASLGGLPLTPELDALQKDSIWFDHMYATGTRSVRGIEAVVAGFPPTTARSVVKLPRSQTDFFTMARLLAEEGYSTSFLYSGEPQFDNMGRFFANNGFEKIIGRHDFTVAAFDGDWGAADEDLFRMADEFFRRQPGDQPFFSLLFTTSNHSPFDYPADRIEPFNSPAATVENAVKYADHALGEFIRNARRSAYWDNTVFLVIADHSDRVYGDELVPIERFHIPAAIVGGPVQPQRIERIASQIDILPTLLSLMGISTVHPSIGIDQTRQDLEGFPGRAVMQYGSTQAYMFGERVAILQKELPVEEYLYQENSLVPTRAEPAFLHKAVAIANWPWQAYKNRLYQ